MTATNDGHGAGEAGPATVRAVARVRRLLVAAGVEVHLVHPWQDGPEATVDGDRLGAAAVDRSGVDRPGVRLLVVVEGARGHGGTALRMLRALPGVRAAYFTGTGPAVIRVDLNGRRSPPPGRTGSGPGAASPAPAAVRVRRGPGRER